MGLPTMTTVGMALDMTLHDSRRTLGRFTEGVTAGCDYLGSGVKSGSDMTQTTRCCLRTMLFAGMLSLTNYPGFSQTPSSTARCHVTAAPFQVRAEGLAERLGDIILQCSGSNPGAVFSGNFTLYLPATVTNRVDAGNLTRDAELAVDLGSGFVPTGIAGQVSGNTISFNGISYTVPQGGNVNLKISNIRATMNQLGYTSGGPAPVTASLSSSLAIDQSQVVLAYSQAGMLSNMSDAGISCYGSPIPDTLDLPSLSPRVRFSPPRG